MLWRVRPNPVDDVGRRHPFLGHVVQQGPKARQLVGGADAVPKGVGLRNGGADEACAWMHRTEMLTVQRSSKYAAQSLAPAAFWPHARPHCVGLAEGCDGTSPLVARARPDVADHLPRQRSHGASVLEAVPVFIRALATGVVAIQTRPARSTGDDELGGAPRAWPMSLMGLSDTSHVDVVRRGCHEDRGLGAPPMASSRSQEVPPLTPDPLRIVSDATPRRRPVRPPLRIVSDAIPPGRCRAPLRIVSDAIPPGRWRAPLANRQ